MTTFKQVWMCGDDVDILSSNATSALLLLLMARQFWAINPTKQIISKCSHEFLQKEMDPNNTTLLSPKANMIAALCSGQWYKDKSVNHDQLI